ncbi:MAG: hypothetical protein AAGB35_10025 [Pseudomonadota bacterium]
MPSKLSINVLVTLGVILLVSSTNLSAGLFGSKISKSITYEVFDSELEPYSALTNDQSNALLALEACLLGNSAKKVNKALGIDLGDSCIKDFKNTLRDFEVSSVMLTDVDQDNSQLSGLMKFKSESNRTALFFFTLDYVLGGDTSKGKVDNLHLVTMPLPYIEIFLAQAALLSANTVANYEQLYRDVKSKSIKQGKLPPGTKDYVAVIMFKQIHDAGVNFKLKISDNPEGVDGDAVDSIAKYYDGGWLVIAQEFKMDLTQQRKYIKLTLQSDEEGMEQFRQETLVESIPMGL